MKKVIIFWNEQIIKIRPITNEMIFNIKSLPQVKNSDSDLNKIYSYLISEIKILHNITIFNGTKVIQIQFFDCPILLNIKKVFLLGSDVLKRCFFLI